MGRDLNRWEGIGRISKDLELRYTPGGQAVANFSLACGDDYKDKQGQKQERTNWIDIVVFGKSAEILDQYCGKGSKIFLTGKLTKRKWQDKDGNDRWTTEVVSNDFQMLDSKPANQGQQNQAPQGTSYGNQPPQNNDQYADFDDDIPFMRIRDSFLYCM